VAGCLLSLAFVVLLGCAAPGGLRAEGPAPDLSASAHQFLVLDYASRAGQRPRTLWLDEVNVAVGLRWTTWGGARATAEGTLVHAACGQASCLASPPVTGIPVRLVLDALVRRGNVGYYRHVRVTGAEPDLTDVELPVPAP
jgi:hypothetical protein